MMFTSNYLLSHHNSSSAVTDKQCSDDLDHDSFSMALRTKKSTITSSSPSASNEEDLYLSRSRSGAKLRDAVNSKDDPNAQWATASATSSGRSAVHEWSRAGSITVDRLAVSLHGAGIGSSSGASGGGLMSQNEKIQSAIMQDRLIMQKRRRSTSTSSGILPLINQPTVARRSRWSTSCVILCYAILCRLCYVVLCYVVLCCDVLCYAVMCCAVMCCATLCCAMICCDVM